MTHIFDSLIPMGSPRHYPSPKAVEIQKSPRTTIPQLHCCTIWSMPCRRANTERHHFGLESRCSPSRLAVAQFLGSTPLWAYSSTITHSRCVGCAVRDASVAESQKESPDAYKGRDRQRWHSEEGRLGTTRQLHIMNSST